MIWLHGLVLFTQNYSHGPNRIRQESTKHPPLALKDSIVIALNLHKHIYLLLPPQGLKTAYKGQQRHSYTLLCRKFVPMSISLFDGGTKCLYPVSAMPGSWLTLRQRQETRKGSYCLIYWMHQPDLNVQVIICKFRSRHTRGDKLCLYLCKLNSCIVSVLKFGPSHSFSHMSVVPWSWLILH